MRILVIGGTGTIGREVTLALADQEVISVSRKTSPVSVDIQDEASVASMYKAVGRLDAVICTAGDASFAPFDRLTGEDFSYSVRNMLMGQVTVVRLGLPEVSDGGSITLTSGSLARSPMVGGVALSLVTAALDGFVMAAAYEAPRGIRINAVSPPWISETLSARGLDPRQGLPAAVVAQAYLKSLRGSGSGEVIVPS
jgi:NAD(P)-dependent dehydrogenase (short-subunit alcohol dehydrogenase family)